MTDQVRLRFIASDDPNNSIVEAGIDELLVEVFDADPRFNVYGSGELNTPVAFHVNGPAAGLYGVLQAEGTGLFNFAVVNGPLLIDPLTLVVLLGGTIPPGGLARDIVPIPNDATLVGTTLYFQGIVQGPGGLFLTNRDELTFE